MDIISDRQHIGMLLLRFRREQHLTQQQLAQLWGISQATLSRWEHGQGGIILVVEVDAEEHVLLHPTDDVETWKAIQREALEASTPGQ